MTNKEILTAVLFEWLKPVIPAIMGNKIANNQVVGMFENWIKNTGIAPANWSIMQDITPLIQRAEYNIIMPFIMRKLDKMPDEYIPQMAHGIVDSAISNGSLNLFGGYVKFSESDLKELKSYLDCNLPYTSTNLYKVIKPEAAGTKEPQQVETNKK